MKRTLLTILISLIAGASVAASAKELPAATRKSIDSLMNVGLRAGYYPGASIAIGNRSGTMYEKCYGWQDNTKAAKVSPEDVYDIASLTKVVATTFAVMRLYDQFMIDVNKTVGDYIHCYDSTEIEKIPLSQLLTHTSGLPYVPAYAMLFSNATGEPLLSKKYDKELYPYRVEKNHYMAADLIADSLYVSGRQIEGYRRAAENLYINPAVDTMVVGRIIKSYKSELRGLYRYSDTNFYILRQIVEKITGQPFDMFTRALFDELEMSSTGYKPLLWKDPARIIPTEYDYMMRRGLIKGYVHDDLSALNGGVEGNAGIFSTASDLARFCRMMISEGLYDGKRILSRRAVQLFTASPLRARKIYRGLGFDKRGPDNDLYNGYGHTGFTGTIIWMDPSRNVYMVFLSNRVNPSRVYNGLAASQLRTKLWNIIK